MGTDHGRGRRNKWCGDKMRGGNKRARSSVVAVFVPLMALTLVLAFLTFQTNAQISPSPNDTKALSEFMSATDAHGALAKNWTGTSVCNGNNSQWEGVTCRQGRVYYVSLPGYDLRGPVTALSALDQLRTLNLHGNRLNGSVDPITKCTNLKLLYLSANDLSGSIPPRLSEMRRLVRVDLSDNNIRGVLPASLRNLTRLLTLRLQNNILSGPLPDLSFISDLNVSNNELSGEIPRKMMSKFSPSAFQGNAGLCGKYPFPPCSMPPPSDVVVVPSNPSVNPGNNNSSTVSSPAPKRSGGLSTAAIIGIVVGDVLVLFLITALCFAYYWRRYTRKRSAKPRSEEKTKADGSGKASPAGGERSRLVFFDRKKQFELEDLLRASAEMLGKGSFGTAYKAVLDDGFVVAVKRLKDVGINGKKEFDQHMAIIGKLRHPNVVRLRAYYFAKDEKLLVCDYLPNGSLHSLIHGNRGPGRNPLDWTTRLSIVLSAARGLAFIHEEYASLKIPHGNIKSSNILLDKNGNACISDFGLALLLGSTHGWSARQVGYRAPEQQETKKLSQKADVYSFGVLLLEVLTGKAPVQSCNAEECVDLPKWVKSIVKEEWTAEVFDIELMRYKNIEEEMISLLQIALSCVSQLPEQRPKMTEVVKMIENIRAEQSPARGGEWDDSHSMSPPPSDDVPSSC